MIQDYFLFSYSIYEGFVTYVQVNFEKGPIFLIHLFINILLFTYLIQKINPNYISNWGYINLSL